ncbi:uncharacterized protein LOC120132895 isoform X3 [Hibiscus syriacus]|uniref:uncharacterized protein LOC120132895 isoform X3 n=1 Tax=Hibiscus syriacus TaxID=106335 RepID=UPI0019250E7C|nr:uncharacterized protein LOC120132895 isoform X3 [Hibiscus syriacus]
MSEQAMEKPFSISTLPENGGLGLENTPPLQDQKLDENPQDSGKDLRKTCTPDRLKVPKAFKYPERYRSPTDSMMSPVTKGLLARNRKAGGSLLPPSINQTKIHELRVQDNGLSQN